jgi:hypothetical protein
MHRILLALLVATTTQAASAADLTPHQQWLSFVQGAGYNAAGPTGMYAVAHMKQLESGNIVYMRPGNKRGSWEWFEQAPSTPTVRVEYTGGKALISGPGIDSTNLLESPDRQLTLPNRLTVRASLLDQSLKLWLYNPDLVQERKFRGLDFFPFDAKGVVSAQFTRYAQPEPVNYLDSREHSGVMYIVGTLALPLDGRTHTLKAYSYEKDGSKIDAVLLLLKDKTSGKTSYGGGRVVEVQVPKVAATQDESVAGSNKVETSTSPTTEAPAATGATVSVNLNTAYSFLCAHSECYNCPLTLTDRVDAALTYGEKFPPL